MGVIVVDDGRPSRVRIDHDHLQKPDPILAIPQDEFRGPVQAFLDILRERIEESDDVEAIVGVVLFRSVARGTPSLGRADLLCSVDRRRLPWSRRSTLESRVTTDAPGEGTFILDGGLLGFR